MTIQTDRERRDTMRGVVLTGFGGPDRLVWREDLPMPVPLPGEVLVQTWSDRGLGPGPW